MVKAVNHKPPRGGNKMKATVKTRTKIWTIETYTRTYNGYRGNKNIEYKEIKITDNVQGWKKRTEICLQSLNSINALNIPKVVKAKAIELIKEVTKCIIVD